MQGAHDASDDGRNAMSENPGVDDVLRLEAHVNILYGYGGADENLTALVSGIV